MPFILCQDKMFNMVQKIRNKFVDEVPVYDLDFSKK